MKTVFGIDLGTTYSCISHVDDFGKPVIIHNGEGEMTTPSVVYFESPDNIVVGRTAREHCDIFPDRVVSCVKRGMGDDAWIFDCDGMAYKPQEIAAFILRRLAADAKSATGLDVQDVIITCPAYFGINQKEATRQAGELAGLTVLGIIPEPTAAALAYITDRQDDQTVLVYDLGGGTFDITLMHLEGGEVTVVATGGDEKLGGRNWDEHIVEYFVNAFCDETGADPDELYADRELHQELFVSAEACKKSLTSQQSFRKTIRAAAGKAQIELTREAFEDLTRPLLLRTLSLTDDVLEAAAAKGVTDVSKILLVGGSTYMPQIHTGLLEHYGARFELVQFRPNQAVAEGAALYGQLQGAQQAVLDEVAHITGQRPDSLDDVADDLRDQAARRLDPDVAALSRKDITNVTPKGFGILVMTEDGRRVRNLIYKDDPIPCEVEETFGTWEDGQTTIELTLMETPCADHTVDVLEPDFCTTLSTLILQLDTPLPAQSPVKVIFRITRDGLLTLDAEELTHGKTLFCRVEAESLLSDGDLHNATERGSQFQVA